MDIIIKEYTDEIAQAIDQICSSSYQQLFEKVAQEQSTELSSDEQHLLVDCPELVGCYEGDRRLEVAERLRRTHLAWFNKWLSEQNTGFPPYVKWNWTMDRLMLHATNLLFRIDLDEIITSDATRNEFQQIADTIKRILSIVVQSNPKILDPAAVPLVQNVLLILFYFTLDSDMAVYLKNLQLVNIMTELIRTSNDDDEILLQAYRILAVIMAEDDLKQLDNSHRIAAVFITFIRNTVDAGAAYQARFHNSLRSLRVLTQHDQIREDLIKQQGYSLFLRCVVEDRFDLLKATLPALEILLALAFDDTFATTLRQNTEFMDRIRMFTASPYEDLQRVATALIWKLDNTQEHRLLSTSLLKVGKKQYDIMISYSHSDKELCQRLLDALEKDQLQVWIDSRLMHGATFDAMAKAIENAEFVFVCMSDAYKQSPFCEMEASYAVKRRCRIIPLVMTPNYKADGWLGVLTSALIYIDFPKLGFERGYEELKRQIELYRMNDPNLFLMEQNQIQDDLSAIVDLATKPLLCTIEKWEAHATVEYPECIDTWTEEQVKSFLVNKKLHALLPVIEGMNGQLFHQTYSMCQANQQGMFSLLREDVNRSGRAILTLKDYLIFLREIKVYIPYKIDRQMHFTFPMCNIL